MTDTDVESGADEETPEYGSADNGLLLAGALLGMGIGVAIAVMSGQMMFGFSVALALAIVIPSGIQGHYR